MSASQTSGILRSILVPLAILLAHCGRVPQPVLVIPFDGNMLSQDGRAPALSFEPAFANFRDRKALRIHPGDFATYGIAPQDLRQGALEFWLKLDTLPPHAPASLVRLSGDTVRLRAVLDGRALIFESRQNSQDPPARFRSKLRLNRGDWILLTLCWNRSTQAVSLFVNGVAVELETLSAFPSSNHSSVVNQLQVGMQSDAVQQEDCEINLRDFRLWTSPLRARDILESYRSQSKAMVRPLVWSATDLFHFAGKKTADNDAIHGWAWTVDTEIAALEAVDLPSGGTYDLAFRVKPLANIAAANLTCDVFSATSNGKRTVVANWSNQPKDLREGDSYRSFSLRFRVSQPGRIGYEFHTYIPSKYSLLMDTATLSLSGGTWQDIRRFEDLRHTVGVWREDADSPKGKAWANANTLHFGPYTCLGQRGRYRATWRIKIAQDSPAGVPLVLLDVYAHDGYFPQGRRGNKSYAKLALSTAEFQQRGAWETKSIDFEYDGGNMMEFRAFARLMRPGAVTIDTITVERLD